MIAGTRKADPVCRITFTVLVLLLFTASITSYAAAIPKEEQYRAIPGIQAFRNIEYVTDGHERQKLDIYLPEDIGRNKALPVIVWVHGGAWTGGSKDWCPALRLAKSGYVVAGINYRLSQHAPFPAQIHDCKATIRWLRANAKKYHIDPKRVGVWGASAGGHLVALLGTTAGNEELEGTVGGNLKQSSRVQAVCNFFGPTDMFAYYKDKDNRHYDFTTTVIDRLLGGPIVEKTELAKSADPVNHVTADDSPFLIMHGDKDDLVPMKQSEILDEALKKAGVETKLHIVKGAGHGFSGPEINKMIDEFFGKHLKAATAGEKQTDRARYRIFDGKKKTIIVNGYSTSFHWPKVLQKKLDLYHGGRRIIEVKSATRGGTPIAGWIDVETGEPRKAWLERLRPMIEEASDKGEVIVLCQQSLQWAFGERRVGIDGPDDKQRIKQGADVLEKYVRLLREDGADAVFVAMHIYKKPMEPQIGNERLALHALMDREVGSVYPGPDVWTPTKKMYPQAFAKDKLHPNETGAEIMAQQWFEALLKHDDKRIPPRSRE